MNSEISAPKKDKSKKNVLWKNLNIYGCIKGSNYLGENRIIYVEILLPMLQSLTIQKGTFNIHLYI